MKFSRRATVGVIGGAMLLLSTIGSTYAAAGWSYTGKTGPNHWGTLDPSYTKCVDGSAQTPIDIVKPKPAPLPNLKFSYGPTEAGVFNNGHTVEAEPLDGTPSVTISGTKYNFLQFHFHAPSEHEINGLHYPVEIHFVNKSAAGELAVVGVFVRSGKHNDAWDPFINNMLKATANAEDTKVMDFDWAKLLPGNPLTIRYSGSLTTPPCSEGVKWNIFSTAITMDQAQISTFLEAYSGNNRPVQPLNGRKVQIDNTPKS